MNTARSIENCQKLRQLAADLWRATTEYTLRGTMNPDQEAALNTPLVLFSYVKRFVHFYYIQHNLYARRLGKSYLTLIRGGSARLGVGQVFR
ncbi:hypothetical protein CGCFRS4_v016041 [Colletotrichum fructicola]|nr:hypothetical protein CGCFRS4_v016041 [Colletotrichum fructicola]